MNFGNTVKAEIISKPVKDKSVRRAFLAGLIRGSGTLYEKDGELGLEFKVADEKTAEVASDCLYSVCGYEVREVSFSEDRLNKKDRFYINISGDGELGALENLGILESTEDGINVCYDMLKICGGDDNRIKAFLRGLFVSSGSCTVPEAGESRGGYHLEMSFSHSATAESVAETLSKFGVIARITRRKESYVLYIKSAEEIKDFLALLPAPVSVLKLTDVIIERELCNNSNRQANCDVGNVNKQIEAAAKQIRAIEKIERARGLSILKPELYETAAARRNYPEETLSELAERLNVSKSCLNHRLRKIVCIADGI